MAEPKPDKPGFFSRLFGRTADDETKPAAASHEVVGETAVPVEPKPGEPGLVFTTAVTDPIVPEPVVTPISPDDDAEPPAAEIAGADLQPVEGPAAPLATHEPPAAPQNWWQRLSNGMKRTSSSLSESVTGLFTKRRLDAATLEELEDALVRADLGRRHRHADHRGGVGRTLRPGNRSRRGQGDPCPRGREGARDRRHSPRHRPLGQALRDPDGRRERSGQDHHHRQAGAEVPPAGPERHARRRRHVPRRRHRAAEGLGRARRSAGHRPRPRRGRRRPCFRRAGGSKSQRLRRAASSTRPGGCRTRPG